VGGEAPLDPRNCDVAFVTSSRLHAACYLEDLDPGGSLDSVARSDLDARLGLRVHLAPGKRDDPAIEIAWSGKRIAADSLL